MRLGLLPNSLRRAKSRRDIEQIRLEQIRAASNSFSRLFQGLFDENGIEKNSQQDLENILTPFYQTWFTILLICKSKLILSMHLNSH